LPARLLGSSPEYLVRVFRAHIGELDAAVVDRVRESDHLAR
jgi:hypothetical protein